jgi:hypothetical protein
MASLRGIKNLPRRLRRIVRRETLYDLVLPELLFFLLELGRRVREKQQAQQNAAEYVAHDAQLGHDKFLEAIEKVPASGQTPGYIGVKMRAKGKRNATPFRLL